MILILLLICFCRCDQCLCDQSEIKCIPTISNLGTTVNLFSGEPTRYGYNAFQFTCDGSTFYDPITKETWQIYKEMAVSPKPFGQIETTVYHNSVEYEEKMSAKVHADGKYKFFSGSAEATYMSDTLSKQNKILVDTHELLEIWEFSLKTPVGLMTPSQQFKDIVEKYLPGEYDRDKYFESIRSYLGTHVIVSMTVGGVGDALTEVSSSYFSKKTEEQLTVEAKVNFLNLKGDTTHGTTSQEWKNSTKTTTTVNGGDPIYTSFDQWDQWLNTIRHQPVKVSYYVAPIYDLIRNTTIQANYKRAMSEYADYVRVRTVDNCTHLTIANKSPIGSLRQIGVACELRDKKPGVNMYLYLMKGPGETRGSRGSPGMKRCLVHAVYGKNNELVWQDVVKSNWVEIEGYHYWRPGNRKGEFTYTTNVGQCDSTTSIPWEFPSCYNKVDVTPNTVITGKIDHMKVKNCIFNVCHEQGYAATYQPYVIET